MTRFWFWLTHNASSAHCRFFARFLEKRGWVAFYLEEPHRWCEGGNHLCWMQLYTAGKSPSGRADTWGSVPWTPRDSSEVASADLKE